MYLPSFLPFNLTLIRFLTNDHAVPLQASLSSLLYSLCIEIFLFTDFFIPLYVLNTPRVLVEILGLCCVILCCLVDGGILSRVGMGECIYKGISFGFYI